MKHQRPGQIILILVLLTVGSFAQSSAMSPNLKIPTVDYCDLIYHSAAYDKKVIRVRGLFVVGFEASYIYYPICKEKSGRDNRTWVEYSDSFENSSNPEITERFRNLLESSKKDNKYGLSRVEVVFVGKFDGIKRDGKYFYGYGHLNGYLYKITVNAIEEVKSVPENISW